MYANGASSAFVIIGPKISVNYYYYLEFVLCKLLCFLNVLSSWSLFSLQNADRKESVDGCVCRNSARSFIYRTVNPPTPTPFVHV